jgi:hypothetical protein
MLAPRIRGALSVFAVVALAACGSSDTSGPSTKTPTAVDIVSGNNQTQLVGAALSSPLVVRVSSNGSAVAGVGVTFAVTSGSASVSPTSTTTDSQGQAKTTVTLGSSPGTVTITANVAGTTLTTVFTEVAGTGSTTVACTSSSPQTPAAGGVLPGVAGTGICLGGGATGAEYAIVAFNSSLDSLHFTSFTMQSRGATAVTSASSLAPVFDQAAQAAAVRVQTNPAQIAFDKALRAQAKLELTPKISGARTWYRQRASFTAVPANPAIGTLFKFNAQGQAACTQQITITARVAAVSNLAIIVADTANPSGGFTDAEYASFAAQFDTAISPIDVANFGAPTDIDNNGKILILFTKEVNKLTPRGSEGVVGGFTHERDLFPTSSTATLQGCAGSNVAEMYYSLVPDPNGVFSDKRSKADVLNQTPGTLVHEYQHLINAGRRLYVNDADDFESVWLNEGLSHIAEELLFYHETNLSPRQNLTTSIFTSQAAVDAFNNVQGANFNRFQVFMSKPARTSVYADNDSLEVRGAIWYLLRYLADHRAQPEASTWQALVNSKTVGHQNLAGVFGADYLTQIRDWATAVFADDIPGVTDARFQEQSWNMRQIWPKLVNSNGTPLGVYPLSVVPLGDASPASLSIIGGGEAYVRFSVPANTQASIDWSSGGLPVSPSMQFTVVRTK